MRAYIPFSSPLGVTLEDVQGKQEINVSTLEDLRQYVQHCQAHDVPEVCAIDVAKEDDRASRPNLASWLEQLRLGIAFDARIVSIESTSRTKPLALEIVDALSKRVGSLEHVSVRGFCRNAKDLNLLGFCELSNEQGKQEASSVAYVTKAFDTSENKLSDALTARLVHHFSIANALQELQLDGNVVGPLACKKICEWLLLPSCSLTKLSLRKCSGMTFGSLGKTWLERLARCVSALHSKITFLDIGGCCAPMSEAALLASLHTLINAPCLKQLVLDETLISTTCAAKIGRICGRADSKIEWLSLAHCHLTQTALDALVSAYLWQEPCTTKWTKCLVALNLAYNSFSDLNQVKKLLDTPLRWLSLSGNRINSDSLGLFLGRVAMSKNLVRLDLDNIAMTHVHVAVLFGMLSMQWLAAAAAAGATIQSVKPQHGSLMFTPPLAHLSLSENPIGNRGVKFIAKKIKELLAIPHPIRVLHLANTMGGDGCDLLVENISRDKRIMHVNIRQSAALAAAAAAPIVPQSSPPLFFLPWSYRQRLALISALTRRKKKGTFLRIPADAINEIFSFLVFSVTRKLEL